MNLSTLNLKGFLLLCAILLVGVGQAQKLKQEKDYVPNQLLIKFKDEVTLNPTLIKSNITGINEVDKILKTYTIKQLDNIFSPVPIKFETNTIKANSTEFNKVENDRRQHFLQLIFKEDSINVLELVNQLNALQSIEFAEPNYYFSIDATMGANKPEVQLKDVKQVFNVNSLVSNSIKTMQLWHIENTKRLDYFNSVAPNDPLFSQQTNIIGSNIQKAWEITTGDSIVIGVLDTGIDWLHPDLKDNIWINWKEFYGREGVDDDGNGLIDDIRGWDWINNDDNPTDDHSHGTHVAGIIAAKGNNSLGISGVNWNAKVMALKILQSTGRGDAGTIAKAVDYAALMGAKILNLSLGGYFESLTLKASLEKAYSKTLIVAAAGNDGKCIGPGIGCAPLYPGAYSFVMGVQDQALYSNYDQDGPFVSKYSNLMNYDTYAPGTSVLSTVPDGAYSNFTGTSMSTPTVAGIASLYMSDKKNYDKELLFAQLIQQKTNGFVDAYKVLSVVPPPDLRIAKYEIVDTASNANKDGKPDGGENINLRIYLKNYSAKADSVSIKLSYAPLADTSLVKFIQDSCFVGSVSPNTVTYSLSALNIKISEKVFHGADYKINVSIKDKKGNAWSDQVVLTFQNAITYGGIITEDVTLYPNKYYYVTENLVISDCSLTIKPGTVLNFSQEKALRTIGSGVIIANGKKDSTIIFTSSSIWSGIIANSNANSKFAYCIFENLGTNNGLGGQISGGEISYSIIRNSLIREYNIGYSSRINNTNIFNNKMFSGNSFYFSGNNNNIINNENINSFMSMQFSGVGPDLFNRKMNVFGNPKDLRSQAGTGSIKIPQNIYLGTIDSLLLEKNISDYFDFSDFIPMIKTGFTKVPCDSCPGIAWKLTLDDKEFSSNTSNPEDVVELGTHKIKVWFNRAMDTTVTPIISFGQREPFNKVSITNKGSWSADKKSYEVSRDFVITDPNGIVNFNVSGAKDDMGMEIPYERSRFRINLQSSSSKTLNFGLTNQCGKLFLKWDNLRTQGSDIIGYNIYRKNKVSNNSGTFALLNKKLVTDNVYTDFQVDIDSTYEYVYTAVRAGMNNETDSSFIVSGQPLRSKLADANGDSSINVADVVTTVNRILQKDPLPFVFKQTDMNNDGLINVLDVIGIINRILNPNAGSVAGKYDYNSQLSTGKLNLYLVGDTLYGKSDANIAGIEYKSSQVKQWLAAPRDWEIVSINKDNMIDQMAFTYDKFIIKSTDVPLAIVNKNDFNTRNWLVSAEDGRPLDINWLGSVKDNFNRVSNHVTVSEPFPNPTNNQISLNIYTDIVLNAFSLDILDFSGRKMSTYNIGSIYEGVTTQTVNLKELSAGNYLFVIRWKESGVTYQKVINVIKK